LTGAVLVAFEASLAVAVFLGSLLALALMCLAWTGVSLDWAGVGGGLDKVGGDGFVLLVEDDFAEEDAAAAEEDFDDDETAVEEDFDEDAVAAEDDFDDDAATAEDLDFDEEDAADAAALAEAEVEEDDPSTGGIMIAFAMTWYSMEASLRMPRNMLDRLERRAVVVSDASLTSTTSLMAMLDVESFFASPSSSFSSRFLL
jgi:hypothetical protein